MTKSQTVFRMLYVVAVVLLAGAGLCVLTGLWQPWRPTPSVTVTAQGPVIEEIQQLSELVTTRVQIADILEAQGETHRGIFIIKGDALLGVDLAKASMTDVNHEKKTFAIRLPRPHVVQARVDHKKTRTWDVQRITWVPFIGNPDLIRDEAMRQAQELVQQAATTDETLSNARAKAEDVISTFYRRVGWQPKIQWESVPLSSTGDVSEPHPKAD